MVWTTSSTNGMYMKAVCQRVISAAVAQGAGACAAIRKLIMVACNNTKPCHKWLDRSASTAAVFCCACCAVLLECAAPNKQCNPACSQSGVWPAYCNPIDGQCSCPAAPSLGISEPAKPTFTYLPGYGCVADCEYVSRMRLKTVICDTRSKFCCQVQS